MKSTRDTTRALDRPRRCRAFSPTVRRSEGRCDIDDIVDRGPVDHGFVVVNKSTSSSPSPPLPALLPPFIPPTHDADASWRGGGKARAWKKPSPIRHGVVCARDCVLRVGCTVFLNTYSRTTRERKRVRRPPRTRCACASARTRSSWRRLAASTTRSCSTRTFSPSARAWWSTTTTPWTSSTRRAKSSASAPAARSAEV